MKSATKRNRRKTQQEVARQKRQREPKFDVDEEDTEIVFQPTGPVIDPPTPLPLSPPDSLNTSAEVQYEENKQRTGPDQPGQ